MSDWTIGNLGEALSNDLNAPFQTSNVEIKGFSIDSRTVMPGDVFVAIKGENFDGHNFIADALKNGSSAIIASEKVESNGKTVFQVKDTLVALQNLARWHRNRHKARFIGITGSNGKTTTKEMLYHLFSGIEETFSTKGNLNNHIGLPLSILRIPLSVKVAIIEMGMNHPGEIRFLCGIAKPDDALITNIGPAHIGILGSLENIANAKSEILEGISENGYAFLPGDDPFCGLLVEKTRAKVFRFGFKKDNDITATDICINSTEGSSAIVNFEENVQPVNLLVPGRHNIQNAIAAIACCTLAGNSFSSAIRRMESFKPVTARLETISIAGMNVILDCYNANPASMREAVKWLSSCSGRKIAVLGDMRELGEFSTEYHREIGKTCAESEIDMLVAVGQESAHIAESASASGMKKVFHFKDLKSAADNLKLQLEEGDNVLLKASRGMHFESICKQVWPQIRIDLH
ncbi:MAG: UDP-N-acetylmuramoyl-tripeptide--D-alanyl-D-alanine ligase [Candidatus Riflebacteria bacterium]|nr:UDP-N-acetylmuramoyl-tripeptide--D-alanyl-D-alanine ligase [Candidatus Riflebacteria bacterium]